MRTRVPRGAGPRGRGQCDSGETAVVVAKSRKAKTARQAKFRACLLSAEQVEAPAETLTAHGKQPYDLLVRFVAYTGLRAAEVSGLDVADIHLRKTKTGEWRGFVDVHRARRKERSVWVEDTPRASTAPAGCTASRRRARRIAFRCRFSGVTTLMRAAWVVLANPPANPASREHLSGSRVSTGRNVWGGRVAARTACPVCW